MNRCFTYMHASAQCACSTPETRRGHGISENQRFILLWAVIGSGKWTRLLYRKSQCKESEPISLDTFCPLFLYPNLCELYSSQQTLPYCETSALPTIGSSILVHAQPGPASSRWQEHTRLDTRMHDTALEKVKQAWGLLRLQTSICSVALLWFTVLNFFCSIVSLLHSMIPPPGRGSRSQPLPQSASLKTRRSLTT